MGSKLKKFHYYINFPNPNFNYTRQNEDGFVSLSDKNKIPVILLFGWSGCQDKHLAKYSKIYEDRGLITLRFTAPVEYMFWKSSRVTETAEKIIRLLVELKLDKNPTIIHLFSNGGSFMYQHFLLALAESKTSLHVVGAIFDSGPGKNRITSLFGAFRAILGGKPIYNIPISALAVMAIIILKFFKILGYYILTWKKVIDFNPFVILKIDQNKWPQHFIYSKKDSLTVYKDVEEFAEYRKSKGESVTTLLFENSPHVEHYIYYKESYIKSVCTFIQKCLKNVE